MSTRDSEAVKGVGSCQTQGSLVVVVVIVVVVVVVVVVALGTTTRGIFRYRVFR